MTNNRYSILILFFLLLTGFWCIPAESLGQSPTDVTKIILDPGHGGQDTGSKNSGGLLEKDLTWALAEKLARTLEAAGAFLPIMTRKEDQTISLDERAGLANNRQADLLISVHLGDTFTATPMGFSIYYWSPTTASPTVAPAPTERQPWDREQEPYWQKSRMLASLMQEELLWTIPWASGGVLAEDIYLLRRVRMPAVLLEFGSLNHPEEAAHLQKPEFQQAVAKALTQAIVKYRSLDEKDILLPQPTSQ